MLKTKRVYEPAAAEDGERILVERLWPRGLRKDKAQLSAWLKEVAPSTELRKAFHHEARQWEDFRRRYESELEEPDKRSLLEELAGKARQGNVTLVYAARDEKHNVAVVLEDLIGTLSG